MFATWKDLVLTRCTLNESLTISLSLYKEVISILLYQENSTRPEISYAINK